MTLAQIKAAVKAGKAVHWQNNAYRVGMVNNHWYVEYIYGGSNIVGLVNHLGELMGGEENFFVGE